jgi:hypothetical protein
MSVNVRSEIVDMPQPVAPNWKSSNIVTQKTYPVSSVLNAGVLNGNLEFQYSVPKGFRQDVSRSYIIFDATIATAGGADIITTCPAFNMPAAFFNTGRLELNDYLASSSNNVAQDDTVFKRLTKSYTKYTTVDSASLMYGADFDRFQAVQTVHGHMLAWRPDCLMSPDQIYSENVKVRLILAVNPNINTPANSPCFSDYTGAAGDGVVTFSSIYMVNTFIKVDAPLPKQVFIPAYSVKSTYQAVAGTSANLQYSIPKDTFKIVVALQSTQATTAAGAVSTKFTSGTSGAAQSAESLKLTGLQLSYAGQNYPASMYSIVQSATATRSTEAWLDFLGASDGNFDPSGSEPYSAWSDAINVQDISFGRLFCFNIVKPTNDESTNAELTINFSPAVANTKVWLFSVTKTAIGISYGANDVVEEVKTIPFSG